MKRSVFQKMFYALFFLCVLSSWMIPVQIVRAENACSNCVCGNGAPQGGQATQDACKTLCEKNGSTFKSCETAAATPAPKTNVPKPTTCDCYCATSAGADKLADKKTQETCVSACKAKGKSVAACAFTAVQAPDRLPYCYKKDECTKQKGVWDKDQAWDCVNDQHYCFADPAQAAKVTLNVAIPNPVDPSKPLTLTGDIGEYINAMFSFMIKAGVVIAIVMVMIGGLQYTIGAAGQEKGKGKDRIKNGITGLVLLLCVNLIASTVNPYLLRLKVPEFPMIKPIGLPEGASTCEEYKKKVDPNGKALYKLETDSGKCGDSSNVLAAEGQKAVAGGISCDYSNCGDDPNMKCLNRKCMNCIDLGVSGALKDGIKPSASTCGSLTPKASETKGGTIIRCAYVSDPTILDLLAKKASKGKVDISSGFCGTLLIKCPNIHKCEDYNTDVLVIAKDEDGELAGGKISDQKLQVKLQTKFYALCGENPCKETMKDDCQYDFQANECSTLNKN